MQSIAPQNRHIEIITHRFLSVHWDQKSPLLLGYSGGPDSKALLYALIEEGIKPDIVHVDHGWRGESITEAQKIEEEAEKLGCRIFSQRIPSTLFSEEEAREKRFSFFSKIWRGHQALFLAHTLDDLAETVLKRLLEGAHLPFLGGMQEVGESFGLRVFRPFLSIKKSEILSFLEERGLSAFWDKTNGDERFLRARLRKTILPFLEESFGKNILENLALLSRRSFELKRFLEKKCEPVEMRKGPWGIFLDFKGVEAFVARYAIQKFLKKEGITLPRKLLDSALEWIEKGVSGKSFSFQEKNFFVDKRVFWIPKSS